MGRVECHGHEAALDLSEADGFFVSSLGYHGKVVQVLFEALAPADRQNHRLLAPFVIGDVPF
jgi:hypothetical protein